MKNRGCAHSLYGILLLVMILVLSACDIPNLIQSLPTLFPTRVATNLLLATPTLVPSGVAAGSETNWLQIFFTDPTSIHAKDYQGGPDAPLAADIDKARLTLDVAAYSLNLWSIRDALIHAHQRGVVVRMVMESDNMGNREVQQIIEAGIPIVGDQRESLMHDKFMVIDRAVVWTGSMNFTTGGAYQDNNNLLRIESDKMAQDYTSEFEEMFIHHLFGQDTMANTPFPKLDLDEVPVEVYFSPDDHVAARIIALIQQAQKSIDFMAYTFTSNDIGDAMIQQAQAGVIVKGVMDNGQINSSDGSEYDAFKQAGLDVRLDGNEVGLMHHKVIIIDQAIIITGSYNFTASAEENNDENVVIIFSSSVAGKYMDEFRRVFDQAPLT